MLRVGRREWNERAVHRAVEPVPEAEAEVATARRRTVDDGVDRRLQPLEHLVALGGREQPLVDRVVELLLRIGEQRLLQAVDGLALGPGDRGQRVTPTEPLLELCFRQAEVVGCRGQVIAGLVPMAASSRSRAASL